MPYTDEMIENAKSDLETQVQEFPDTFDAFTARYPKALFRDFDGNPDKITELDALIDDELREPVPEFG